VPEKTGHSGFSQAILQHPEAKSTGALNRIALAKRRVQSILDRETVACQKTLEQKISDQGPTDQRVDPHLVGLSIKDLLALNRLREHRHLATASVPWYANPGTPADAVSARLADLAPLYASITRGGFGNLTGDALELVTYKVLDRIYKANPRYAYQGHFDLAAPKTKGRYRKTPPPKAIAGRSTQKEADFFQFGHTAGPLCIECKNYREWLYPQAPEIAELIIKAADLDAIPVLIARRLHYSARTNLLEPAGIIAHESYFQYYPADQAERADKVRHRRSLGFTDVTASEDPHPRTVRFLTEILPKIVDDMAARWKANKDALVSFAKDEINLAQLYTAIDSPAGGKWTEPEHYEPEPPLEDQEDQDE
jgi:hypothetical protein